VRKKGDVPILEITTTNFRSDRISLTGKKMWRKMWRKQSVKWLGGWIARTAGPLGVPFTESLHQQKTASATSTASSESCVFTQYDAVDQKQVISSPAAVCECSQAAKSWWYRPQSPLQWRATSYQKFLATTILISRLKLTINLSATGRHGFTLVSDAVFIARQQ